MLSNLSTYDGCEKDWLIIRTNWNKWFNHVIINSEKSALVMFLFLFFSWVSLFALGHPSLYHGSQGTEWIQRESVHFDGNLQRIPSLHFSKRFYVSDVRFCETLQSNSVITNSTGHLIFVRYNHDIVKTVIFM